MNIGLPSGIGDVSWAWSKLYALRESITGIQIADGWPYRTTPYVELFYPPNQPKPEISYGKFGYQQILQFTKVNQLENPRKQQLLDMRDWGCVLLEPNRHLELGRRLEDWMPDLPTEFHYPLYTTNLDHTNAIDKLSRAFGDREVLVPVVGISCASYRGAEAWHTWGLDEWRVVLKHILDWGWQPLLLGGFWDDLTYTLACDLNLPELVGKTSVGEMVELMRLLPGYIGFSSGLNVIRTVVDRPALALWPSFQAELSTSWVPQDMLESRRYVALLWQDPKNVLGVIQHFLDLCGKEVTAHAQEVRRQENGSSRAGVESPEQTRNDAQELGTKEKGAVTVFDRG